MSGTVSNVFLTVAEIAGCPPIIHSLPVPQQHTHIRASLEEGVSTEFYMEVVG